MRTNAEYRRYMTEHASGIMQDNMRYACDNLNARAFAAPVRQTRVGEPHVFVAAPHERHVVRADGGVFGYETNATKDAFLEEYAREASAVRQEYV